MMLRRFQISASQDATPSAFDRVTFVSCMTMIALTLGVVASYGPAAALQHLGEVVRNLPVLPATEADLYALSALPF